MRRCLVLLAAFAMVLAMLPAGLVGAQSNEGLEVEVIAEGLRNPRHISAVGPSGGIVHVAEAGVGGDECVAPDPEDEEFEICYGLTGRVTRIVGDDAEVVIDGLPSLASPAGEEEPIGWFATGPHDFEPVSAAPWLGFVAMGAGLRAEDRDALVEALDDDSAHALGTLLATDTGEDNGGESSYNIAADLVAWEAENNPDGKPAEELGTDSNPYAMLLESGPVPGTFEAVVADAGGNSLLRVPVEPRQDNETALDEIELITVFPPNPQPFPPFLGAPPGLLLPGDPVPTSVTEGPDGSYLVGELPGFPFQPGAARVWSVDADGTEVEPEPFADGFATVIDVLYDPSGDLYVLELVNEGLLAAELGEGSFRGALVRYDVETGRREVLLTDPLFAPGGMAWSGLNNDLLITNCSICGDEGELTGQVLRVSGVLDAEPIAYTEPTEAETDENQPVEIDVLANDSEGLEIVDIVDSGNGATLLNTITYQPKANFSGVDRVKYQACTDEACVVGEAVVRVNDLPTPRFDGRTRIETAVRSSRGHFPAGAGAVLLARQDQYPDALAGAVLAAAVDGPVLLTTSNALHPLVIEEINRLGAGTVYLLGGTAALSAGVETAVGALPAVQSVERVSGANRFATAAAIRDEIEAVTEEATTEVFVAEGQHPLPGRGWPDVLSVSPVAASQLQPILLVTQGLLPPATEASLRDGVTSATVVGGVGAVSASVFASVDAIVDSVDRVEGRTRYETSAAVAELAIEAGLDPALLYLATGRNWPDALTAGPSVAREGGVLLLTDPVDLDNSPPVRTFLRAQRPFDNVNLLGGVGAISALVEQQVRQEIEG
jgi:putative cell wall-binding protein